MSDSTTRNRSDFGPEKSGRALRKVRVILTLIWSFMKPILKSTANQIVIEHGLPLAREIVKDLDDKKIASSTKLKNARASLRESLDGLPEIVGEKISNSILNLVIEMAVSELKSKTTDKK